VLPASHPESRGLLPAELEHPRKHRVGVDLIAVPGVAGNLRIREHAALGLEEDQLGVTEPQRGCRSCCSPPGQCLSRRFGLP